MQIGKVIFPNQFSRIIWPINQFNLSYNILLKYTTIQQRKWSHDEYILICQQQYSARFRFIKCISNRYWISKDKFNKGIAFLRLCIEHNVICMQNSSNRKYVSIVPSLCAQRNFLSSLFFSSFLSLCFCFVFHSRLPFLFFYFAILFWLLLLFPLWKFAAAPCWMLFALFYPIYKNVMKFYAPIIFHIETHSIIKKNASAEITKKEGIKKKNWKKSVKISEQKVNGWWWYSLSWRSVQAFVSIHRWFPYQLIP